MRVIQDSFRVHLLAVKYFLQGDSWTFAKEYAQSIVYGFRQNNRRNMR